MIELFNNIDNPNKIKILQVLESITSRYQKNKNILSSVKKDNIACIITYGHIQIVKYDQLGNQTILKDLKENDIFSSISINLSSDDIEIITKEDSEIIIIELDNIIKFNLINEEYRTFINNLIKILINKNKELHTHLEIISQKTIRDKLLAYFKTVSKNEQKTFILPMSYNNLAEYLATNRSAMSRELRALKDEGLIQIKGKKIKIQYYT